MVSLVSSNEGILPCFVHTPLSDPANSRLFCIEAGKSDDAITLTLFESRMSSEQSRYLEDPHYNRQYEKYLARRETGVPEHNEYMAVSYVWGDHSDKATICINKAPYQVTRNLYLFLKHMRSPRTWRGPYWVDAICINQSDNEEKTLQVIKMSRIFSETWIGIVWLGPEGEDSSMAFEFFDVFETKVQASYGKEEVDTAGTLQEAWISDYMASYSPRAWEAVFKLWCRPWFFRIWTVQEFVLPADLDILCGARRLSWRTLVTFYNAFRSLDTKIWAKLGITEGDGSLARGFESTCWHREHYQRPLWQEDLPYSGWPLYYGYGSVEKESYSEDLLSSVSTQRHRGTADERDKIFGLIGLSPGETFPVDYTLSASEVYRRFAIFYLYRANHWRILADAGYPRALAKLPTWVPDWSATPSASNRDFLPKLYAGAGGMLLGPGAFQVSKDYSALIGRGLALGSVAFSQATAVGDFAELAGHGRRSWLLMNESLVDHILAFQNTEIWKDKDPDDFVLKKLLKIISFGLEYAEAGKKCRMSVTPSLKQTLSAPDYTQGRAFFVTEHGFTGLGPRELKLGDVAVIFIGLPFPFIVREKNKHVEIVGPCYVDGVMDGEMRTGPPKHKTRSLEIR